MSITKKSGKWLVRVDRKNYPRVSRSFETRGQAEEFERDFYARHRLTQSAINHPELAAPAIPDVPGDTRKLLELIDLWYKYHGANLSDHVSIYKKMKAAAIELGNPIARDLKAEAFMTYRFNRLQSGIDPKTVNIAHIFLSSMFSRLKRLKVIDYPNPLAEIEKIKTYDRQLTYLTKPQINLLLETIKNSKNPSAIFITEICLRTGARWGEVENLKRKQLHDGLITFEITKSKRTRTIPLEPFFYQKLLAFCGFKEPNDRIFINASGSFRYAVKKSGISMQKGQNTHILRHSFARHFIMNGGNILALQKILGHSDISMTMKYAHLAPDHLSDAIKFNPIA
jgi:integrase